MVTIVFESHGTTLDNEAGLSSGGFDMDLSELGEEQARQLGVRYTSDVLSAIFCSDMKRSWKTADIVFAGRDVAIIKDKRLRECDYGDLNRHPKDEVEPLRGQHITTPFPNGESYEQCAARMKEFLQDLLKKYNGKKVMVIGHRATQYGLEHWIKGVPLKEAVIAPWQWQPGWVYELRELGI